MKTLQGIKKNSIKTKLTCLLLAVALVFSAVGAVLLTNYGSPNGNDANAATVTTVSGDGMGQFANSFVYMFSDKTKMADFRAGSASTDTTIVKIDTNEARGTTKNPYVIATYEHWEAMVKFCGTNLANSNGKVFVLANDVDFAGKTFHPITHFAGTFYGRGYAFKNITVSSWQYWNGSAYVAFNSSITAGGYGIFGYTNNATVADFDVVNFNLGEPPYSVWISTYCYRFGGGIIGIANGTTNMLNCHTISTVTNTNTNSSDRLVFGGIIGKVNDGSTACAYRCSAKVGVADSGAAQSMVGGIMSIGSTMYIYDCYAVVEANVTKNTNYTHYSSIASWLNGDTNAVFEDCVGYLKMTRPNVYTNASGALIGTANGNSVGKMKNCFAQGIVQAGSKQYSMYGIIGNTYAVASSRISNTYVVMTSAVSPKLPSCHVSSTSTTTTRADLLSRASSAFANGNTAKIWNMPNATLDYGSYTVENSPVKNPLKIVVPTNSLEVTYNGQKLDFVSLFTDDPAMMTATYDPSQNYTDIGTYTLDVDLASLDVAPNYLFDGLDETVRHATVTVKIVPAKISIMGALPVTEYGVLKDGINLLELTDGLYNRDLDPNDHPDGAPVYKLEYRKANSTVWTETVPTVSGDYYVRAKITNSSTCNYVLDGNGEVKFTMPKQNVAVPYFTNSALPASAINGTVTTVPYTGDYQVFKLVNSADGTTLSGVTIGARTGSNGNALTYNQLTGEFRAKGVGTYTVTVSLADGGANTRWANYQNTEETRIITIVITKAELNVTILNSSVTSWQKGEVDAITAYVTGIKNDEKVKVKVTCGPTGSTGTEVADEAMTQSGDTITIKVNLASFDANQAYSMKISLADGITANDNYTLNTLNTSFDFFILTAVINNVPIAWQYDNLIAGYGQVATDNQEVDYNGQPYEMKLDETQLPNGIIATYKHEKESVGGSYIEVDECINMGTYRTTVTISTESGYELANNINTVYTISWKIKAIEYDLAQLIFADNPQWTGKSREMTITNQPDWMTVSALNNRKIPVGTYVGTWTVEADENHVFKIGSVPANVTQLDNDGKIATLQYSWQVTQAVIPVSNSSKQWTFADKTDSVTFVQYKVAVPAAYEEYGSVLKLTYYDAETDQEVDINSINVTETDIHQYYCIVTLDESVSGSENYRVVNETNGSDFAKFAFSVGNEKYAWQVEVDIEDEIIYDGQGHSATAVPVLNEYQDANIKTTYYKVTSYDENGDPVYGDPMADGELPTEVGDYVAVFNIDDPNYNDDFTISNKVAAFKIVPLVLSAESWTDGDTAADPFATPTVSVTADIPNIPQGSFGYKYYDPADFKQALENGTEPTEIDPATFKDAEHPYGKKYIAKLVSIDGNVKIDETSPYYYEFTTGADPDGPLVLVPDPEPVKNVYEVTGEPITVELKDFDEFLQYVEVVDGSLTQTAIGQYTVTFKLKDGVRAQWAWDGADTRELTFEIIGKIFPRPTLNKEIRYTGEDIYVTDFIDGFDPEWMEIMGDESAKVVGDYRVVIMLKDPTNSSWADEQPQAVSYAGNDYEISLLSDTTVSNMAAVSTADTSTSLDWTINKAQVSGSWQMTPEGYEQFVLDDPAMSNFVDFQYYEADAEGKPTTPITLEEMSEEGSYVVVGKVKDEHSGNVEFVIDGAVQGEEITMPFSYTPQVSFFAGLMAGLLNFVQLNWKILVIAAAVLLLGIAMFAVIKHLKNTKEKRKDAKAKKAVDKKTKEIAKQQEKAKQKQEKEQQKALEKQAEKNGITPEQQKQINAMNGVNPDGTPAINPMMAGMMGGLAAGTIANAGMPNAMNANGMPMANGVMNNGMPMAGGTMANVNGMPNATGVNALGANGVAMGANGMPMVGGTVNGMPAMGAGAVPMVGANGVPMAGGVPYAGGMPMAGYPMAGYPMGMPMAGGYPAPYPYAPYPPYGGADYYRERDLREREHELHMRERRLRQKQQQQPQIIVKQADPVAQQQVVVQPQVVAQPAPVVQQVAAPAAQQKSARDKQTEQRLKAAEERLRVAEERAQRANQERIRTAEANALRTTEERARLSEEFSQRSYYNNMMNNQMMQMQSQRPVVANNMPLEMITAIAAAVGASTAGNRAPAPAPQPAAQLPAPALQPAPQPVPAPAPVAQEPAPQPAAPAPAPAPAPASEPAVEPIAEVHEEPIIEPAPRIAPEFDYGNYNSRADGEYFNLENYFYGGFGEDE